MCSPWREKSFSYCRISRDWPMAAHDWMVGKSSGRSFSPNRKSPAPTAPLLTITHSCPALTSAATSAVSLRNCAESSESPFALVRIPVPNFRMIRMSYWGSAGPFRDGNRGGKHGPPVAIPVWNVRDHLVDRLVDSGNEWLAHLKQPPDHRIPRGLRICKGR